MNTFIKLSSLLLALTSCINLSQANAQNGFQATGTSQYHCGDGFYADDNPEALRSAARRAEEICDTENHKVAHRISSWSLSTDYAGFCGSGYAREGVQAVRASATFICEIERE